MSKSADRDYVLGTHDEELARLGLQHRVWRPTVLECWHRAGITVGSRVLDVGAGPGYATVDLAEIVGPTGLVVAVERSSRFVEAGRQACAAHGLAHVRFYELDLMTDTLPAEGFDASWCRWVASFVSSPRTLVEKVAAAVRVGGVAIFHEYIDYASWRYAPARPLLEEFVRQVMASWRESGGEPDIAPALPPLLAECGFRVREATPRVFCARPRDHVWRWPAAFLNINLERLRELGRVDAAWLESVRREFQGAEADPETLMITPMVLEIVAERQK
jgi:SAM-dependent methyltransferase